MKNCLFLITLLLFTQSAYSLCSEGYLCRDNWGKTYYMKGGFKIYQTQQQIPTVSPGLLNAIANPAQVDVVGSLHKAQQRKKENDLLDLKLEILRQQLINP